MARRRIEKITPTKPNFIRRTYYLSRSGLISSYSKTTYFISRRPLTSFFLALLLLFGLIAAGNFLAPKKEEVTKTETVKQVQVYRLGESPMITLQAKIEKSGVIKISALSPGVIQSINAFEGDIVQKGSVLVNMSSNYQGGNAASIQRQLAQKQYQNSRDTLDAQKAVIENQRQLATKSDENAAALRDITNQSLQETRDLIDINQSLLDTLSQNQTNLEQNNPGGINDAAILQVRSQRVQVQSGLSQLRQGLRQAEFQASGDKPPAELARLQKETTLKQLDIQQKALDLGLEVSRLQVVLAQISEALYFPSAPFAALVQRVYVKEGQAVNPGTPLMTLSAIEDPISAIVNLPGNLAGTISTVEPSIVHINDTSIELNPTFISTEATDGTLYAVFYKIPDSYSKDLTEGGMVSVDIPSGITQDGAEGIFVPLDSVYQSGDLSSVMVVKDGKAESKTVKLGNVFGRYAEVKSGLLNSDTVILNRNVIAGDKVTIQNGAAQNSADPVF